MSRKARQLEFKLNIGDNKGKCHTKIVRDAQANALIGLKIGDKVDGNLVGLPAYEFIITGGSDKDGFPHRASIDGLGRRKYLLSGGIGYRVTRKGRRIKKSVRGNIISEESYQINMKISKNGKSPLEELISEGSSSQES
ncbi:MAG: 30S ribosomal protein S6e [Candidatus Heimdallarchaeota archaeon]|nr:30S ribosomal protein S6e [Candidatus Heimdallarchaeota archaeon]MCK4954756.1 30S ribosomal protein S6e [Candidatus Heimdallarchaeota archaeon]